MKYPCSVLKFCVLEKYRIIFFILSWGFFNIGIAQELPPRIQFSEIFETPIGMSGMNYSPKILALDGQWIEIIGYMIRDESTSQVGEFLLSFRPLNLHTHSDGQADDLPAATVMVQLDTEHQDWRIPYQSRLLKLNGFLKLGRYESKDGRVVWIRLQLTSDALRSLSPFESFNQYKITGHNHP